MKDFLPCAQALTFLISLFQSCTLQHYPQYGPAVQHTGVVCSPLPKKTPQRGDCGQSQFPHTTRLGLVSILKVKNK